MKSFITSGPELKDHLNVKQILRFVIKRITLLLKGNSCLVALQINKYEIISQTKVNNYK